MAAVTCAALPVTPRPPRAITLKEHQLIVAAEKNHERKLFYELLWQIGASQSDAASLNAPSMNSW